MESDPPPIQGVATGTTGFAAPEGPDEPAIVTSIAGFEAPAVLGRMLRGFFANGGTRAYVAGTLAALDEIDDIALICPLPEDNAEAIARCERRRDRVAVLSLPAGRAGVKEPVAPSSYAAVHHPWVRAWGELTPPGGHVAGLYASAGTELRGLDDPPLEFPLSDRDLKALVDVSINPLRDLRAAGRGVRVWGGRTLSSDAEFRYLAVRRLLIFLETSIDRGLEWVVFEPNAEPLWHRVRDLVGNFLTTQWRAGLLQGQSTQQAYFVRCGMGTTMTQNDLDDGRLICEVGVAAVKPAEFVIFRIGKWTADREQTPP